jgi:hypothetical protein
MRRKSPTSVWRRSISSTKTTSETPSRAYNSLFEAAAADTAAEAARAEAAAAAFEAAGAAFEAAALAFEAAEAAALAFEAAAGEAAAAVAAAVGAGVGAAVAACRGEVAPSARLGRLGITLKDARVVPGFDQVRPHQRRRLQGLPDDARVRRAKSGRVTANLSRSVSAETRARGPDDEPWQPETTHCVY